MTDARHRVDVDAVGQLVADALDGRVDHRADLAARERLVRRVDDGLPARGPTTWLAAGGVLAFAAAVALSWWVWPRAAGEASPVTVTAPAPTEPLAQPQTLEAGAWIEAPAKGIRALAVGPGTALALRDGARGRVAVVEDARVVVVLEAGRIDAEVDPGARRKVAIEAGPYRVTVVGTVFRVDWDPSDGDFAVEVTRGKVEVAAPASSAPIAVDAGRRLVVDRAGALTLVALGAEPPSEQPEDDTREPATPRAATDPERPSSRPRPRPPEPSTADKPSWQALVRSGEYEKALALVDATGFDAALEAFTSGDLEELADAARLAGQPTKAEAAYLALRRRFAKTPAAARAAFQLGRQTRGARAVEWLRVYLDEAPTGSFAKLARGRLVVALTESGDKAAARDAARVYLESYPDGPHAKTARALLESAEAP